MMKVGDVFRIEDGHYLVADDDYGVMIEVSRKEFMEQFAQCAWMADSWSAGLRNSYKEMAQVLNEGKEV